MNQKLHWLTTVTCGICTTLILNSTVQAAELITASTSAATVAQPSTQILAVRTKKRLKKKIKLKRKIKQRIRSTATKNFPPADSSQLPTQPEPTPAPTLPAPVTPPPTPLAPPTPEPVPAPVTPPPAPNEPSKATAPNQFSTTTKLQGQVIFGVAGTVAGDFSRNTVFGHRSRLELKTDISGGTLTTRLQATGLGLSNQAPTKATTVATPEGNLSWTDGTTTNSIGIDALKYEFALSPQTQMVIAANAGAADDFTDTINPYLDGDGASGSVSAFGNRPSIYYTVQGAGAGIRHKLSDNTELSLGYLARTGSIPTVNNGLLGGAYGALAQLTFKTGENSKVGVAYTRTLNSDLGTGSTTANSGGTSNNFGVSGSFQISPQFALGGWAGYTQNQVTGSDRQIWTWALTAAAPDFGNKGNLAGLVVGQEPRVTAATNGGATDSKSGLHIEGFYQIKVNDNVSITPGIIYLTAPNQDANSTGAVIGALRTTFSF